MYCVSIGIKDFKKAVNIISDYEMAEIRLDLCEFDRRQVKEIFASHKNLIATFRKSSRVNEKYRESILKTAIAHGAKWLDLDMESNDPDFIKEMKEFLKDYGCKLILSVHNYKETPEFSKIEQYIAKAKRYNPELIKLVFFSNSQKDNDTILKLYNKYDNIIAFNMGEIGKITRVKALERGAPFTYVAIDDKSTAPGQMTREQIKKYPKSI